MSSLHETVFLQPIGPLTFVFVEEGEFDERVVGAHCLELDLADQGSSREEATKNLQAAVESYVLYHLEQGLPLEGRPAPEELSNITDRETFHFHIVLFTHVEGPSGRMPDRRAVAFAPPPPSHFTPQLVTR